MCNWISFNEIESHTKSPLMHFVPLSRKRLCDMIRIHGNLQFGKIMSEQPESSVSKHHKSKKDKWVKFGFLILVVVLVIYIQYSQRQGPKLDGWREDLTGALEHAKRENAPILVFFMSRPPGEIDHFIANTTIKNNAAALKESGCILVRIAVSSTSSDIAKQYDLTSTPTLMLLDSTGKEISRRTDRVPETDLPQWLNESLGRTGT